MIEESKGIVERANGYLETSFLPGRTFASPEDFNAQLSGWLEAAKVQRTAFQNAAAAPEESGLDAELRDLADYDRAFGVVFGGGQVLPCRRQGDFRADRVLRPGDEGTADSGGSGPSGRPGEAGWSHEESLAAVLSREVAAREASGAETRARAAGFPARKSLEGFSFDHQTGLKRETIAHQAGG